MSIVSTYYVNHFVSQDNTMMLILAATQWDGRIFWWIPCAKIHFICLDRTNSVTTFHTQKYYLNIYSSSFFGDEWLFDQNIWIINIWQTHIKRNCQLMSSTFTQSQQHMNSTMNHHHAQWPGISWLWPQSLLIWWVYILYLLWFTFMLCSL